jgi:hypothetical protein
VRERLTTPVEGPKLDPVIVTTAPPRGGKLSPTRKLEVEKEGLAKLHVTDVLMRPDTVTTIASNLPLDGVGLQIILVSVRLVIAHGRFAIVTEAALTREPKL